MPFSPALRHSDGAVAKYLGKSSLTESSAASALLALIAIAAVTTLNLCWAQTGGRGSASNGGERSTAAQPVGNPGRRRPYSSRELRDLVRNARTPEDHDRLAACFRTREGEFRAKETYHQEMLTAYLKAPWKFPAKYPTRGDIARDLAAYYGSQARKTGGLALEHERLAAEPRAKK